MCPGPHKVPAHLRRRSRWCMSALNAPKSELYESRLNPDGSKYSRQLLREVCLGPRFLKVAPVGCYRAQRVMAWI
jgi:hypothetical protein